MTAGALAPRSGTTERFSHETFLYRADADFLAGLLGYVREGLELDEAVVVVEPKPRLELLRDAMGADAGAVRWLDMLEVGANPARIIPVWTDAVAEHVAAGRGLRGIGEPAYAGRRPQEFVECQVHEALLNHAFDVGPGWRLLCPYDETALPAEILAGALRSHRVRTGADGDAGPSADYAYGPVPPEGAAGGMDLATLDVCAPLPPPTDVVLRGDFGPRDVPAVRRTVGQYARSCGLSDEQVENLELAASELATNSIRHGGGVGSVAMWQEPDAVIVEFTDEGRVTDPLTGRRRPEPGQDGGMGLFLVNQLCDLVQLRTSDGGTVTRLSTWQ